MITINLTAVTVNLVRKLDQTEKQVAFTETKNGISDFYNENHTYPTSLTALAATPGFEHLKKYVNNSHLWLQYNQAVNINDGTWIFDRVGLAIQDPKFALEPISSFWDAANNQCGTGAFNVASSWCGGESALWWKDEEREHALRDILKTRASLDTVMRKLVRYFNVNNTGEPDREFPNRYHDSTVLADGTADTLVSLVGFGGTAINCTGVFVLLGTADDGSGTVLATEGVPLSCNDMYSEKGFAVKYLRIGPKHAIITVDTGYDRSDGSAIIIGSHMNIL